MAQVFPEKTLREKCPNTEFFWCAFSGIWTEYGEIRSISQYSVRMRETIFGVMLSVAVAFLVSDFLIISNFVISYVVSRGTLRFFLFFCNVLVALKREWFP